MMNNFNISYNKNCKMNQENQKKKKNLDQKKKIGYLMF